ncbi:MAG: hypothetical protein R3F17_05015 [Planctomycetota bacterium]
MTNSFERPCEEIRQMLPLMDGSEGGAGELDKNQRLLVAAHLEGCAGCAEELRDLRRAQAVRREWWLQDIGPAPDLRSAVMARIGAEPTAPAELPAELPAVRRGGAWRRFSAMAAAACLAVGAWGLLRQEAAVIPNGGGALVAAPHGNELAGGPAASALTAAAPEAVVETGPETPEGLAPAGGLHRVAEGQGSSIEARPWGLEEAPAVDFRPRESPMMMVGGH